MDAVEYAKPSEVTSSSFQDTALKAFFEGYRLSHENQDIPSILNHYNFPCQIKLSDEFFEVDRAKFEENDVELFKVYNLYRFKTVELDFIKSEQVEPEMLRTEVKWKFADDVGYVFTSFSCFYDLIHSPHNEIKIARIINIDDDFFMSKKSE